MEDRGFEHKGLFPSVEIHRAAKSLDRGWLRVESGPRGRDYTSPLTASCIYFPMRSKCHGFFWGGGVAELDPATTLPSARSPPVSVSSTGTTSDEVSSPILLPEILRRSFFPDAVASTIL